MTFEQYAHRRLPELLRIAQSICGDRALGEELVQDVLVKLHRAWPTVRDAARPDAYVRRMLVNEFPSWRRKWARVLPFAEVGEFHSDRGTDHAQTAVDRDALVREIGRLPQRPVLTACRVKTGPTRPLTIAVAEITPSETAGVWVHNFADGTSVVVELDQGEQNLVSAAQGQQLADAANVTPALADRSTWLEVR